LEAIDGVMVNVLGSTAVDQGELEAIDGVMVNMPVSTAVLWYL
jgi:hypothetical protein